MGRNGKVSSEKICHEGSCRLKRTQRKERQCQGEASTVCRKRLEIRTTAGRGYEHKYQQVR